MKSIRRSAPLRLVTGLFCLVALGIGAVVLCLQPVDLPRVVRIGSVADLQNSYAVLDYGLPQVRQSGAVPHVVLTAVPHDWDKGLDTDERKRVFFETVLPLVLIANRAVMKDRRRLLGIVAVRNRGAVLAQAEGHWLAQLAWRYRVDPPEAGDPDSTDRVIAALRPRVAPVPPSLALAQSAVESAYGTSRFATGGNALFGQWTSGSGMTPEQQRASKTGWTVARFTAPLSSVEAYLRNLNTHNAYREFRRSRASLMQRGGIASGPALATTLSAYSEKGAVYMQTLREIIRTNDLASLDRAFLEPQPRIRLIVP
jgi:Bax protein